MASDPDEVRDGVGLTHLDQELLTGDTVTKRALVDHLDAVADRMLPLLAGRPLSVVRARGRERFMQKNLPKGAPDWIRSVTFWSESSQRDVHYALADDRATLLWFANQRAVEYHVPLTLADDPGTPTHLVLDLDPPEGADLAPVVAAARAVREVLRDAGFDPAVKTSGAKGLHVVTPILPAAMEDVHAATRAVATRAERLDPDGTTTAFIKADRGGKVFLDATRAGRRHRRRRLQPARAAGPAGLVPVRLGRARRRRPVRDHGRHPRPLPARAELGGAPRRGPRDPGRPHRGGPHHPGRAGRGDARGQAPQACRGARGRLNRVPAATRRHVRYRRYRIQTSSTGDIVIGDLAGIGPVKDALTTTNSLLEQVLHELRRTNDAQLDAVVTELRAVRASVDRLVESQESAPAA